MSRDTTGYTVQSNFCASCPFRPNELGEYTDYDLATTVIARNSLCSSQICHSTDRTFCRGHRNIMLDIFANLGTISAPTDEAWDKLLISTQNKKN